MLLVIPVSKADILIPVVTQAFSQFHPGAGHDLLVVGSPNVKTEVNLVALTLAHYFNTSGTHIFPEDSHYGWPISCNYYWKETAFFVSRHYTTPWLWFELDTTPVKAGWLSMLEQEYINNGKPFCGVKEPTVLADDNGFQTQDGHYMVPVGMYLTMRQRLS
jgi:hypothetical protein